MEIQRVETIANRLKEAMQKEGKRQADLVRATGIDKGAMSNYLKGKYEPKQDVVFNLAEALNVSELWLCGYDCDMKRTLVQKNNDTLSDIIVKLRTDKDFYDSVYMLFSLEDNQLASVKQMLTAFLK